MYENTCIGHPESLYSSTVVIDSQLTVIHSICTLENSDVNTPSLTGLEKSPVWLLRTGKSSYYTSYNSFSLAQWAEGL